MDEAKAAASAQRWKALFYVRLAIFGVYLILLYLGLTDPDSSDDGLLVIAILWLLGGLIYLFAIRTIVMTVVLAGFLLLFVSEVGETQANASLLSGVPLAFALIVPTSVIIGVVIDILLLFAFAVWQGAKERSRKA